MAFHPARQEGRYRDRGQIIGTVPETERTEHRILVPPLVSGTVVRINPAGEYTIEEEIAVIETPDGKQSLRLSQSWPVRQPRPNKQRLPFSAPLLTGQRVIDTLFPVAKVERSRFPADSARERPWSSTRSPVVRCRHRRLHRVRRTRQRDD